MQNDPRMFDLDLWLSGDSDIGELTHALQNNTTVCSASILYTCPSDLLHQRMSSAAMSYRKTLVSLLETLGSIPTLRKICVTGPTSQNNAFPVAALASVLKRARCCRKFSLGRLITSGTDEDFEELAKNIENHPCLEDVYLNGSIIVGGLSRFQKSQERLMHALAKLSTLRTVTLNGIGIAHSPARCLSLASLAYLAHSKSLTKLLLYDFYLDDDHIEHLSVQIKSNTQLREIRLSSCVLGNRGLVALSRLLQSGAGRLQVLHLWIKDLVWDKESTLSWIALAGALQCANLRDFRLLTGTKLQAMARSAPPFSTGDVQLAFSQAIKKNYQLQEFSMPCNQEYQNEIAFYLKLNMIGRRKLFRRSGNQSLCARKEEWVEVLSTARHDVSCLFYFLSMNPTIC